jgi:hypothetical protein
MSVRAQLKIPVEKQHTCDACGCAFRFQAQAVVCGVGMGQESAMADLHRKLPRHLEQLRKNPDSVVAKHPCPNCGRYPPELNHQAAICHGVVLLASFIVLLIAFGLGGDPGPKRGASLFSLAWFGVVAFALIAAGHVAAVLTNPNRDPRLNQKRAQRKVAAGALQVVTPGRLVVPQGPANLSVGQLTALLLVLLAPLPFFSALAYRACGPGVQDNPSPIRPDLIGPGDEFLCLLPGLDVQGVGRWRGRPTARVLNAKEVGIQTIPAQGNEEVWGADLEVYVPRGSRLENSTLTPLVTFRMPDDPNLGGKLLQLQVEMKMTYAFLTGPGQFADRTAHVRSRFEVRVAPPGYTEGVRQAYLVGLIGGGLSLLGGIGLTLACIRWKAKASEIFLPEPETLSVG